MDINTLRKANRIDKLLEEQGKIGDKLDELNYSEKVYITIIQHDGSKTSIEFEKGEKHGYFETLQTSLTERCSNWIKEYIKQFEDL